MSEERTEDRLLRIKTDMVDTIIAAQCEAGGVDTEGSRHEAERWCAWLCQCVCDGMRATTEQSAYRLKGEDGITDLTRLKTKLRLWGKPLGRP